MTLAEQLLNEAYCYKVSVQIETFPDTGPRALYINLGPKAIIILHPTDTQAEMACLLAEELGHHYTSPRHRLTYKTIEDAKAEARARRWAHRRILPPERILDALRAGIRERWELAEYLDVTEEFLEETFEDYKSTGDVDFFIERDD